MRKHLKSFAETSKKLCGTCIPRANGYSHRLSYLLLCVLGHRQDRADQPTGRGTTRRRGLRGWKKLEPMMTGRAQKKQGPLMRWKMQEPLCRSVSSPPASCVWRSTLPLPFSLQDASSGLPRWLWSHDGYCCRATHRSRCR